MRRSQTGFRPVEGRPAGRARQRKLGVEWLETRALMAAAITEYPVLTAASQPFGIVSGPDGNLWFTESAANNVAKIVPTTGAVTEYPVLTPGSAPLEITAGPAGSDTLYFTETNSGNIGEINTTTGVVNEFALPTPTAGTPNPYGITLGSDGNIWFTDANPSDEQIGMLNVATGVITEYPLPQATGNGLTEITSGADGNLWFVESTANEIGELSPSNPTTINQFPLPTAGASPFGITSGPDGNLWFTEQGADQIGTINPTTDAITEYTIPTAGAAPKGITSGPDGNLWFTEENANQIGRISPTTGAVEEFAVPTAGSGLAGITTGPDDALWFAEESANQIGRLDPTQILQATGTTIATSAGTAFTGIVASFTSESVNPLASDYSAMINWGDGTMTAATGIAPNNTNTGFNVGGTHTYTTAGTYTITVTITDDFSDTVTATSTANVSGPVTPPVTGPIPTVTGLVRTGIHNQPTQITLTFSSALNPTQADNALNYSIVGLPYGTVDTGYLDATGRATNQYIHVLTAVYDATNNTVTLTTYEHLSLTELYQITVHSGPPVDTANGLTPDGLQSPAGVYLAGSDDTPGTDYVTEFRGGIIPKRTVAVRTRTRTEEPPARTHHRERA